jgi:hypothetical protein
MPVNYPLKYRTFDQLLDDVRVDFQNMALESMIEPQQMIKVAKRVSYDLGLRIFMTKETVLEVEKGRVKLPDDFYTLNFALLCTEHSVTSPVIQGTYIEEKPVHPVQYQCAPPEVIDTCNNPTTIETSIPCDTTCQTDPCNTKPCVKLDCKGDNYEIVQITKTYTRHFRGIYPLSIKPDGVNVDCDCPNLRWQAPNSAYIKNGFLYTNFDCGKVYINYQGALENEDGQLLVLDHDMINDYYEYAVKERILENLLFNDEPVDKKLVLVQQKLRLARIQALSIVNTPNFSEMKAIFDTNRKAQYAKYVNMFKSYQNLGYGYGIR